MPYIVSASIEDKGCMMRNRVLVMGGAGFLGSHLCDRLVGMGNDVICAETHTLNLSAMM